MQADIVHKDRLDVAPYRFDKIDGDQTKGDEIEHLLFFLDKHLIHQRFHDVCGCCGGAHSQDNPDKNEKILKFILFYIRQIAFKCFFHRGILAKKQKELLN